MTTRRIDEIVVGERHRRDLGDITSLAANLAELGLLHPILIRSDEMLIVGERRLLLAAKALGWTEITVNVVDLDAVVKGEFAENAHGKDFTLSGAVAMKRPLEAIERQPRNDSTTMQDRSGAKHSGEADLAPWSHKRKETLS